MGMSLLAFVITINGAGQAADAPWYAILSGRANTLEVRADMTALGVQALTATLARTCPDGRTDAAKAALSVQQPAATFDLGAFATPAQYDFEHGVVYRRGYRFTLTLSDAAAGADPVVLHLYQGPAREARSEALWVGDVPRHVYNSDQTGAAWSLTCQDQGQQMDPPFALHLDWAVLADPDDVRVRFGQRAGLGLAPVPARLIVTRLGDSQALLEREATLGPDPATERLDVSKFEPGDYRIELQPAVPGTAHREGPALLYHRAVRDPAALQVSPLAPWILARDPARAELAISDLQDAVARWGGTVDTAKWTVGKQLIGTGDVWAEPVVLRPGLQGYFAVFARSVGTCYLSVGKDAGIRRLNVPHFATSPGATAAADWFVVATDMTDGAIAIYASGTTGQGLASLRLVPVTAESVARFEQETSHPPTRLAGVCDWLDYFLPGAEPRVAADQFETLVKTHAELGMRDLHWAIGRGAMYFDSKLPDATRFPGVPLTDIDPKLLTQYPHFPTWDYMVNHYYPLTEVEKFRERYGVRIQPWLAMQRHYGGGYGGVFRSTWFAAHPEWHEWRKGAAAPTGSTVCYFFPEVRKERVDILCELAERGPDGLLLDGVRQPPMLGYHPQMVAAYKAKTGIDALTLDAAAGQAYEDWLRWRAGFFTETLRELKTRLEPIRARTGRQIPVILRIPSAGLFYTLAQGFDLDTWCRDGLLDMLELEPLEDFGGRGSHDVRPYVELGRRHRLPVLAGINANTMKSCAAVMKRARGLLDAGVDGIYFYESSNLSGTDPLRWVIPLLGNRDRLREFLQTSNLEACDPVRATNCCSGFDNHSTYDGSGSHDVFGRPGKTAL